MKTTLNPSKAAQDGTLERLQTLFDQELALTVQDKQLLEQERIATFETEEDSDINLSQHYKKNLWQYEYFQTKWQSSLGDDASQLDTQNLSDMSDEELSVLQETSTTENQTQSDTMMQDID